LSHLTGDFAPEAWAGVAEVYRRQGVTMQVRPRAEIQRFFGGLDLVEPGLEVVTRWRPESTDLPDDKAVSVYGGVARKT
jgi:S-adenosyl methyltransferase